MAKNRIVIVVPGGLGTTLSLNATRVWDFNLFPPRLAGLRLLIDPALLDPWLALTPGKLLSVYDNLIKFLVQLGYVKQTDLFLWGYDWRLGMEANAAGLADFVNSLNLGTKKIVFIAHSSGCMVVRWALLFGPPGNLGVPLIDNALVDSVVAAGPPMLGIAGAFKDMLHMPRLNDTFDALFAWLQALYPSLAAQVSVPINRSLMAVTAQLEVLPPNNIPILSGGLCPLPNPYGVFDWMSWPPELDSLRAAVQTTQGKLLATPWGGVNCTVIASKSCTTNTGFNLGANDQYFSDWNTGDGDDSVLLPSAQAYCPGGGLVLVNEHHRTLLDDPIARTFLQSIL